MKDTETFDEYIKNSRVEFVDYINGREWDVDLRVAVENILIAYDQLVADNQDLKTIIKNKK